MPRSMPIVSQKFYTTNVGRSFGINLLINNRKYSLRPNGSKKKTELKDNIVSRSAPLYTANGQEIVRS